MFSSLVNLNLNNTQIKKLQSISNRITSLSNTTIIDFHMEMKKHAATIVRKCLEKDTCENFHKYFELKSHNINTRNNGLSVQLPKCKLEFSRRGFHFMGAKIYNSFPREIRELKGKNFYQALKTF